MNEPSAVGVVWFGQGEQCASRTTDTAEAHRCDLIAGHDGSHWFVFDHDADGDVSCVITWPSPPSTENPE